MATTFRVAITPYLFTIACLLQAQTHAITATPPKGWKETDQSGVRVFVPGDLKESEALIVLVSPPENATKDSPAKQYAQILKKANEGVKIENQGEVAEAPMAGGKLVIQAFLADDKDFGKHARLVGGLFIGSQRATIVVMMNPGSLLDRYEPAIMGLLGSIKFKPLPAKPPASKPIARKAPTGDTPQLFPGMPDWRPSGTGVPLPATAIVKGRPQGHWYKVDSLTGVATATRYVFLADGTFLTNPRWGGGSLIDVQGHFKASPKSGGTFKIVNGKLSTQTSGFNPIEGTFSSGKDAYGLFFKQGAAIFRELKLATMTNLEGTWRNLGTQYVFRKDGTFDFGQVASNDNWIAGSIASGTYFMDGHLAVLEFTGRHTTVVPINIVTDRQILLGSSLMVRH